MTSIVESYFHDIFTSSSMGAVEFKPFITSTERSLSDLARHEIDKSFTKKEIKVAVFSTRTDKALGPYVLYCSFFKKLWPIVRARVSHVCLVFLNDGVSVVDLKKTMSILSPKVNKPIKVTEFRLISLYNVIL